MRGFFNLSENLRPRLRHNKIISITFGAQRSYFLRHGSTSCAVEKTALAIHRYMLICKKEKETRCPRYPTREGKPMSFPPRYNWRKSNGYHNSRLPGSSLALDIHLLRNDNTTYILHLFGLRTNQALTMKNSLEARCSSKCALWNQYIDTNGM